MAISRTPNEDSSFFLNHIDEVIRHRLAEIKEEELLACFNRTRDRIEKEMDSLALQILSQYDVQSNANHIIITVKNRSCHDD